MLVKNQVIKKRMIRIVMSIVLLICVSLMLFILKEYIEYRSYNVNREVSLEVIDYLGFLQRNSSHKRAMKKFLKDSPEEFYIIGPYLNSEEQHKILGKRWYFYKDFSEYFLSEVFFSGTNFTEGFQRIVFMKNNNIIGVAEVERKIGDFLHLEKNRYSTKEKFKSIEEQSNYYFISQ